MNFDDLELHITKNKLFVTRVDNNLLPQIINVPFNKKRYIDDFTLSTPKSIYILINPTFDNKKKGSEFLRKLKNSDCNVWVILTHENIYFKENHVLTKLDFYNIYKMLYMKDWLHIYKHLINEYESKELELITYFSKTFASFLIEKGNTDLIPHTNILITKYLKDIKNESEYSFLYLTSFISEIYILLNVNKTFKHETN